MVHLNFIQNPPQKSWVSRNNICSAQQQSCEFADDVSLFKAMERKQECCDFKNYDVLETSGDFTKHFGIMKWLQKNKKIKKQRLKIYKES